MNILRKFVFSEKMVAISICEYWKMDRNGAWLGTEIFGDGHVTYWFPLGWNKALQLAPGIGH